MPVTRPLVLSLAWHGGRGNPFPHARAIQRTCLPHHRGQQRRPRSPSEYSGALAAREMCTPQLLFVAYRPQLFHGQWIKLLNHGNKPARCLSRCLSPLPAPPGLCFDNPDCRRYQTLCFSVFTFWICSRRQWHFPLPCCSYFFSLSLFSLLSREMCLVIKYDAYCQASLLFTFAEQRGVLVFISNCSYSLPNV